MLFVWCITDADVKLSPYTIPQKLDRQIR
jgi:hypothetical protein